MEGSGAWKFSVLARLSCCAHVEESSAASGNVTLAADAIHQELLLHALHIWDEKCIGHDSACSSLG